MTSDSAGEVPRTAAEFETALEQFLQSVRPSDFSLEGAWVCRLAGDSHDLEVLITRVERGT